MKNFRDLFYTIDRHSKKWESYFEIYDKHFYPYIDKNPTILEVGVAHGGSTEMYKKYFENCIIHAVDYDTAFEQVVTDLGVKVTLGDQSNPEFWDSYLLDKPNFDIIIDDGGHKMQEQIVTLVKTFPKLNDGGIYLVEDTHTSYWEQWGGNFRDPNTFIEMSKGLVDLLHQLHIKDIIPPKDLTETFQNLWSVTYYDSIVVFEKRKSLPSIEANNGKKQ
jgi:hypothetical protein